MAYGNLKADNLIYDDNGTDTVVPLSTVAGKAPLANPAFTGTVTLGSNFELKENIDGSDNHALIENTSAGSDIYIRGPEIYIQDNQNNDEEWIHCTPNGGVELYHGGSLRLSTTNVAVDVAGILTVSQGANFGPTSALQIDVPSNGGSGYDTIFTNNSSGDFFLRGGELYIQDSGNSNGEWIHCLQGAGVELSHAGTKKLETTLTGVEVTGKVDTDGIDNAAQFNIKPGGEFFKFENSSAWHLIYDKTAGYTGGGTSWTYGIDVSKSYVKLYGGEAGSTKDATVVLQTKTTGVDVTGELTSTTTFQPFNTAGLGNGSIAAINTKYTIDTSGSAFTIQLPASPTVGQYVTVTDIKGTWATNNLTVAQNGNNIQGAAADLVCNVNHAYVTLIYTADATTGWVVT